MCIVTVDDMRVDAVNPKDPTFIDRLAQYWMAKIEAQVRSLSHSVWATACVRVPRKDSNHYRGSCFECNA